MVAFQFSDFYSHILIKLAKIIAAYEDVNLETFAVNTQFIYLSNGQLWRKEIEPISLRLFSSFYGSLGPPSSVSNGTLLVNWLNWLKSKMDFKIFSKKI